MPTAVLASASAGNWHGWRLARILGDASTYVGSQLPSWPFFGRRIVGPNFYPDYVGFYPGDPPWH